MTMIPYPLKQSFIDYFKLNQIDNHITIDKLNTYLQGVILESPDPHQKALEIWDTFVMTNEDFFDTSYIDMKNKRVELRKVIETKSNIYRSLNAFGCVGVSPFCDKTCLIEYW